MAISSKIYANATANSLSMKVLSGDKLTRLIDAKTSEAALKILIEYGFGDGVTVTNPIEYEKLCNAEESACYRLVEELCPNENLVRAFRAPYDYLNLKAVFKAKYGGKTDLGSMTYDFTKVEPNDLKDLIFDDKYNSLTEIQKALAEKIDLAHSNGTLTSAQIDSWGDKAMYEEIFSCFNIILEPTLHEYFKTKVDLSNINITCRAKRNGDSEKRFKDMLIEGGNIDINIFEQYFNGKEDILFDALKNTKYREIVKLALEGDITRFELACDNLLVDIYKSKKYLPQENMDQLFAYLLDRVNSVKNVRIVMVCINNNIDKDRIRERVRSSL